jgi:hypothetical protein
VLLGLEKVEELSSAPPAGAKHGVTAIVAAATTAAMTTVYTWAKSKWPHLGLLVLAALLLSGCTSTYVRYQDARVVRFALGQEQSLHVAQGGAVLDYASKGDAAQQALAQNAAQLADAAAKLAAATGAK